MPMENTITSNGAIFDTAPASNTGGTPNTSTTYTIFNNHGALLRLPTECEQLLPDLEVLRRLETPEKAAFIDTLSITFKAEEYYHAFPDSKAFTPDGEDLIADLSTRLEKIFGFGVTSKRTKGINNYTHAYDLGNDWGHVAIGGIYQRDSVQIYLNGQGCLAAKEGWEQRLFEHAVKVDGTITRVDAAVDYFDGTYTVDKAVEDHVAGLFKTKNAPRNPKGEQRGCWNYVALGLDNTGRTYNIGSRETGKLYRVYEKGFEQAGKLKKHKETSAIFAKEFEDWVRIELELGNQNRDIPLDILLHPAQYLAGSAPALEFINQEQSRIKVRKKTVKATVESAKIWLKQQCGKWLYAFQELECTNETGMVDEQKLLGLVKQLMTLEIPKRLKLPSYENSEPQMNFINFNDKQDYETEEDFINRTFPIVAKTMNHLVNSKRDRSSSVFSGFSSSVGIHQSRAITNQS
jgi:phage replication initiation protein